MEVVTYSNVTYKRDAYYDKDSWIKKENNKILDMTCGVGFKYDSILTYHYGQVTEEDRIQYMTPDLYPAIQYKNKRIKEIHLYIPKVLIWLHTDQFIDTSGKQYTVVIKPCYHFRDEWECLLYDKDDVYLFFDYNIHSIRKFVYIDNNKDVQHIL